MPQASKRSSSLGLVLALAVIAVATRRMYAADGAPPAVAAPTTPVSGGATELFELRIYTAAPGKLEELHKRFRDHTLTFFEKHGIRSIAYWTAIDERHQDRLYYIVAYPDKESREKRVANGIAKDPEFLKVVAESEKGGKLTTEIESVLLMPTDYSPKLLTAQPTEKENAMLLNLPAPVTTYLAAEKAKKPEMLAFCFADNARVHDEGRDYRGIDAIKAWKKAADEKYTFVLEPFRASVTDKAVIVRARLTGNFPGSPIELDHVFTLANDKIASLEIR